MSQGSGAQGSGDASRPAVRQTWRSGSQAIDPALLEKVLQETTAAYSAQEPLVGAEKESLRAVVRRHQGQPLSLHPMAVELVEAMLLSCFPDLPQRPELLAVMSARIAETLMDDPSAQQRLKSLWVQLGGTP
jgi:hypothetical protein